MNQTFVCCSTYHVYISILEAYKCKKENKKSILILFNDIIDDIEEFAERVDKIGVFHQVLTIKGYSLMDNLKKEINLFKYTFKRPQAVVKCFEVNNPSLVTFSDFIRDSEINLFQINRTRAYFLIKYNDNFFRMYEDGYGTYSQKRIPTRYFIRKYITKFPVLKGHDKAIKEVFVSYPEKVTDKILIPKLKKLELAVLEGLLSSCERDHIIACLIGAITIDNPKKATLVITQPLSEDSLCSEQCKIKLYKDIVDEELKKGNFIYLKTHPREKTKYQFDNQYIVVLPRLFPLEVFNLGDKYKISKGISFYSTALYNLTNTDEKILLGEDYLKKEISKCKL